MKCSNKNCDYYPYYGIAPHYHNLESGSFIGSTVFIDKKEWPKNFIEDKEEPGMGTYYCPDCMDIKERELI